MIVMTKQEFCEKILEAEQAMYHTAYAILKTTPTAPTPFRRLSLRHIKALIS